MSWLLVHRKFFEHSLWNEHREFSKAEAWLDLIQQARWKDTENSAFIKGNLVKWSRGQLLASVRFLQTRWSWGSTKRVHRFLKILEKEEMIRLEKETVTTRITICNYDTYQFSGNAEGNAKETDGKRTGNARETKQERKGKNGNESNEGIPFEKFWNAYDHKQGKKAAKEKWERLSAEKQNKVMGHVPRYVAATPERRFRKLPITYLNNETWQDEELPDNSNDSKINPDDRDQQHLKRPSYKLAN